MTFLCDTNIISELARPQPNAGVLIWLQNLSYINISVITVEEIYYCLTAKPNPRIQNWFDNFLKNNCQILPITDEIAKLCGEIRGQQRLTGKTVTQADMMIAATAKIHQLTLVTRNIRDFDSCGIPILNPFT
ncbi:type II toxin-antitoxin system VapC family toxin [Sphaerospermopsis sp. LEGE 08334]|jgi:predicted nucleic acid-binding protein|uniref:type II toxin-antitoxin system VapC family toxin n=1 Tax=Sphaerospermopsis sp. LEGE 08334 TaxID=1828651 RepID=UPI001881848C|nr:type II toxin-antitoxin system VapC family toxin [Sphaerospermopsis sp. LEGE 08334]MBE9054593.1 type II toxin-antitoxin system VapC family toxin [Sphaerospermopsis sp. LEGE 08334]